MYISVHNVTDVAPVHTCVLLCKSEWVYYIGDLLLLAGNVNLCSGRATCG